MATFDWKEEYSVGDAIIDSQHQHLFVMANDVMKSHDKNELTNNVMKLLQYVREHFDYEEKVMQEINFPGYQEHAAMHTRLISAFSALSNQVNKDQHALDLQQFMNKWLFFHVGKHDKILADFIIKK